MQMYPREDGHCRCHYIPGTVQDEDSQPEPMLRYLRLLNADLRRGDVIRMYGEDYRNDGVLMFNGRTLIELAADHDPCGHLPEEFRVIEDGVPLNYWVEDMHDEKKRGIAHNRLVWFNHVLVRDQCLANLKYGEILDPNFVGLTNYGIFTTFVYSGKEFRILFKYNNLAECDSYSHELPEKNAIDILTSCRALLESNDLIPFETEELDNCTLVVYLE